MFDLDLPRSELLVNSIIASAAVLGMIISMGTVAWQLRHQNQLESRRVEQDQLNQLLHVLDDPLDACLVNVMDVDFLRATNPPALASPLALFQAQPTLVTNFRSAFQRFTNIATTLITVIPQCRKRRGIRPPNDVDYENLRVAVETLVNLYNQLGSRYANVQHLVNLGMNAWLADPLQQNTLNSVTAARHHASVLLASLYM